MGHQPPSKIADILIAADVALSRYPRERLGKSGAIMAYALAGLPTLASDDFAANFRNGDISAILPVVWIFNSDNWPKNGQTLLRERVYEKA